MCLHMAVVDAWRDPHGAYVLYPAIHKTRALCTRVLASWRNGLNLTEPSKLRDPGVAWQRAADNWCASGHSTQTCL
jgi:hypothetical protein